MTDRRDWAAGIVPGAFTLKGQGYVAIASSGTRVPLAASSTPCQVIVIRADKANGDVIYLGSSTVTADSSATGGLQLSPGDYLVCSETDLAHVYINGAAGDGVSYAWW